MVLILDNVEWPRRVYFVCSGLAVGLACLTKPSGMPAFIMIWGLVWVYFVAVNARNLRRAAAGFALSLSLAAAIVIPYLWLGGYQHVTAYVWDALVTHKALWSTASSPLDELAYYWIWFDRHLGMGGWLLLITGLSAAVVSLYRRVPVDRVTLSYLAIAAAWYLLVTATKSKNMFLGVPFYLFLCLFSWAAIAGASQRWLSKTGVELCVVTLALGTLLSVAGAAPFLVRNLHEPPQVIGRNREVLRQIALDLKGYLKPGETFAAGDWYYYAGAVVPYYSISDDGMTVCRRCGIRTMPLRQSQSSSTTRWLRLRRHCFGSRTWPRYPRGCQDRAFPRRTTTTERFTVGSTGRGAPTCLSRSTHSISLVKRP